MLLLDESHIQKIGIDWDRTIGVIEDTVSCMIMREYVQPVKPYLRYRDIKNRIIAMPALLVEVSIWQGSNGYQVSLTT